MFQLLLTVLISWTIFAQKGFFQSKTQKLYPAIEFCIFKFQFKLAFSFCGPNLPKNGVLLKMEKANTTTEFPISLTNFSLKRYFCFFGPNLPKKCVLGLKLKKCTPQNSGYSNLQKYVPNFSLN